MQQQNQQLPELERIRNIERQTRLELKKLHRKLEKQVQESDNAQQFARFRQIADSLHANPAAAPKGTAAIKLENIHTREIEDISLNPRLDAHENAELLYKKARKAQRGSEIDAAKVNQTKSEIIVQEKIVEKCEQLRKAVSDSIDIEKALLELETQLAPDSTGSSSRKAMQGSPEQVPYRYIHIDGWDIYIGRNDEQNDELSVHFAKPADIWLHVAGHAGSHVVIRRQKSAQEWPPRPVLEKAAALAVWFSKAKHTSYAEVHVTEARFVRKRRHAPPGEVIAERCKSLRVSPISPQEMFRSTPEQLLE